jgi:hypothetical protein
VRQSRRAEQRAAATRIDAAKRQEEREDAGDDALPVGEVRVHARARVAVADAAARRFARAQYRLAAKQLEIHAQL